MAFSPSTESDAEVWTAVDLVTRFGAIPLNRILLEPEPGTATEEDVVRLCDHEDRLCELVDGILVDKTMGWYESYLAMTLGGIPRNFVAERNLGVVAGADGLTRLFRGMIRIPDTSFTSWQRLPGDEVPQVSIAPWAPDLAVDVLSKHNTPEEMQRQLQDYFQAGVRLVWYVEPVSRTVQVYRSPTDCAVLSKDCTLDGGDVLPGFELPLTPLFAVPKRPVS